MAKKKTPTTSPKKTTPKKQRLTIEDLDAIKAGSIVGLDDGGDVFGKEKIKRD